MSITFTCQCGKPYKVKSKYAGKKFLCESCNQVILVPGDPVGEPDSENDTSENQESTPPERQHPAEDKIPATKTVPQSFRKPILWAGAGAISLVVASLLVYLFVLRPETDQDEKGTRQEAKDPRITPPKYVGHHDVTNNKEIYGWAWDATQPDTAISVDIYDGDNLLATVKADVFRKDLIKKGNGGKHGFRHYTPASLRDGKPHSIRVRFAGTNIDLRNSPKLVTLLPE
jgi:hypothetical protein